MVGPRKKKCAILAKSIVLCEIMKMFHVKHSSGAPFPSHQRPESDSVGTTPPSTAVPDPPPSRRRGKPGRSVNVSRETLAGVSYPADRANPESEAGPNRLLGASPAVKCFT